MRSQKNPMQQQNQNIEPTLEQLLMQLLLNPAQLKTFKKNLTDFKGNKIVIAQSQEESSINPSGYLDATNSEDIVLLSDGTSLCGITVCQTCGGVVKEENIRRCKCGQTCCIRKGCGKYSKSKNEWYCSRWHKFLDWLGFNLR